MERIAMNNYRPLSVDEKIFRIEEEIRDIENEREPLVDRKREIESMLTDVNAHKKEWLPDVQFRQVVETKTGLVKEKYEIEERLRKINKQIKEKLAEKDRLILMRKKEPKQEIQKQLMDLRDKYMAFASDGSRVSSRREMAAKFAEEINAVLKFT